MAERTPLYMDINNVYSGDEMGLPNRDFISEGVVLATDMAVTAGAGNTVNIAAGACWVVGDTDIVNQPTYRIINDAVVNLGINPDPTNPRIVRVGMQINDAGFSGVLRNGVLTAIHGTPAGAPATPAEPSSFLTLATVLVPAAAASSAAYTFTDLRQRAAVGGGQAAGGMVKIADVILAGLQATIDIQNLSQTFSHLKILTSLRCDQASSSVSALLRFNADAGANYADSMMQAVQTGAVASGENNTSTSYAQVGTNGTTAGAGIFWDAETTIQNYGRTDHAKLFSSLQSIAFALTTGNHLVRASAGIWNSTAAINRLTFSLVAGNFIAGSRVTVYGLV